MSKSYFMMILFTVFVVGKKKNILSGILRIAIANDLGTTLRLSSFFLIMK